MKVLMVSSSAFPFHNSGVAYVVHNMAKELTQMGHEVTVIGLSQTPTTINHSGYKVIGITLPGATLNFNNTLKESDYNNTIGAKVLEQHFTEINPDIVHFHSLQNLGASTVQKAKEMGYKTVVTMHDWWWLCPFSFMADSNHKPCNQVEIDHAICKTCVQTTEVPHKEDFITKRSDYLKQILKDAVDLIIPVSNYVESFLEPNGIHHPKVMTIPNGVESYNNKESRPTHTETNPDKIRFGFLGGKHQLKGYDLLIEACQDLDATNYEVHVYGTLQLNKGLAKKVLDHLKGGNIKELLSRIKRHLPNKTKQNMPIIYHPLFEPEEKDRVYDGIGILLSLSKVKESSSLVVREALIRGIPVITTPSGGPEEVIISGKNGIILKETTPSALKGAMEQIIRTNSLKNMEEYIQMNPYTYTCKEQAKEIIAAYERCLK